MNDYSLLSASNFAERYLDVNDTLHILDVGSYDINGTLKEVFSSSNWKYIGMDIEDGPNVDVVYNNKGIFPFDDNSFDVVVSSSTFEHDTKFWITFSQMVRTTKNGGLIFIDTPSSGPIHKFPLDCWRFYPDAYKALSDWVSEAELIEQYIDEMHNYKFEPNLFRSNIGIFKVNKITKKE